MAVRNSDTLEVLLAVAAEAGVPFTTVELAGRGITASAAGTRWVLEVGKPQLDGFTLAGKLIELCELEERLIALWQAYRNGEVEAAAFEVGLAEVVIAMEDWPAIPPERD
ncbi:hypothetical protein ACFXGT_36535 [Streptomyces sp. NPDC059352]|uniref:hypothetical protein n=1 Tax=Streptomyces sp. NPDC059352 TaxID=3346810 RepID=UPI0036843CEB